MPSSLKIEPIAVPNSNKTFLQLPWQINQNDPHWVAPLWLGEKELFALDQHPFWQKNASVFFLASRGGHALGRIAAFLNQDYENHQDQDTGFFGFLESVNDPEVFCSLLEAAMDWLKDRGCQKIMGPFYPSLHYELGFLVAGFDRPPFLMLRHNPPYYDQMMKRAGFTKAKDFYSYFVDRKSIRIPEKMERVRAAIMQRYPLKIRSANLRKFDAELRFIQEVYNDAMAGQWGFTPMDAAEFRYMAKDLKRIIDPDLVLLATYGEEPAGFLLTLPNFNEVFHKIPDGRLFPFGLFKLLYYRKKIKGVRVITLGIKRKFQSLGLGSLFYAESIQRIFAKGYTHGEMSWVMEDNILMNKIAVQLNGQRYKTYRVYQKDLK